MWQTVSLPISRLAIRLGRQQDLLPILALYREVTKLLDKQGLQQWDADYPGENTILNDLQNGTLFLLEKNAQIIGVVVLDDQQHEQYKGIDWQFASDNILVIHRLAVHPGFTGQGIAQELNRFCETLAIENDYEVIRLDAYRGNERSNIFYQKLGYQKTNLSCQFAYQDQPCDCYEKRLITN